MKKKQFDWWTNVREKSKAKYILIYGVLLWGIPVGILSEILIRLMKSDYAFDFIYQRDFYMTLLMKVIIFGLIGIVYGASTWKSNEKKWHKLKGKHIR